LLLSFLKYVLHSSNCMVDFDPTRYGKSSKYFRKNLALNDVIWDYIGVSQTEFHEEVSGVPTDRFVDRN